MEPPQQAHPSSLETTETTETPDRSGPARSLAGRAEEIRALDAFLEQAATVGAALVVTGDPGIGKSALLAHATAQAVTQWGALVRHVAGAEFEADLSYAGLHQLLMSDATDLSSLSAAHRSALETALGLRTGSPPERLLLTSATLALLRNLSEPAPVLLVLDDIHWMDRATAGVLSLVARRLTGSRIGMLLALRTGEESFFDRATIQELRVDPLDDDAATTLLETTRPGLHPSVQHRIVAEAGGNPLALIELQRVITTDQESGADSLPTTLPLTARLRRMFAARVSSLPAPTRRLLLLAALDNGAGAALMRVIAASDHDLEPAESDGMVSVDRRGHRVTFAHPLVRAAVVDLASAPERRAAHRRLADLADDPDVRALHRAEAALAPDELVASHLEGLATRMLDRGDGVRSAALLLRAAELSPAPTQRARRLAQAAFVGAHVTGNLGGAAALLDRARAEDPDATETLQVAVAAASHLLNNDGDIDTAHGILSGALSQTSVSGPPSTTDARTIENAVVTLMTICSFGGRIGLWAAFDDAVSRFGPLLSAPVRVAATTFADPAHSTPEQLRELDRLVDALDDTCSPMEVVEIAQARWYVGRVPRAPLERIVEAGRVGDTVALAAQALLMLAVDDFFAGAWDEAAAHAEEAVRVCEERDYALLLWGARLPGMLLAAARGDTIHLETAHARMRQWALPRNALAVRTFTAYVDGLAALSQSRYREALDHYRSVTEPGVFPPHEQVTPWMVMDLVEAAVRCGEPAMARAHVRAAADTGIPLLSTRSQFLWRGAQALSADDADYPELFDAIVGDPSSTQWPFDLGRLELAYGERLRRDRAMRRARPHLESARERFSALGAAPWTARAEAMLGATGPTRRVGATQATELTAQELQVARLAASGLSNREIGEQLFLSPRTVGAHLYRVFPKLGVTSRAALRDALTAREY
ncbi:LuxR family transcriptional regulator [Intrasporangium oryzae NRRL B-24470]|uniref:LuxR family transcriptional regulator n=1 Tax=Intrasporangium oryzae NRRL B-24470 TaxID=1386089 RepID=W9GCZ2_9MICO|nr:LuxR family transcriptional regulator [Intrasporangium oryzae]EWT02693.1 LuxR family transcriptional regulator [Intrasporangium oryzae NRRL B-24470]